jgi:hypothetical protein
MTSGITRVREGNTGILYLQRPGGVREPFFPNCDLERTRELLLEFQELRDVDGRALKDGYWVDGLNWYPVMVSFLYWEFFYKIVQYEPLLRRLMDGEFQPEFVNEGGFSRVVELLRGGRQGVGIKNRLFYALVQFNNWRTVRRHPAELLFFRFSLKDFRSKEILTSLEELDVRYLEVVPPDKAALLTNLREGGRLYFYGGHRAKNRFRGVFDLAHSDRFLQRAFECAIAHVEGAISSYVREYERHSRHLARSDATVFYGFDDCNGYVFPVLYACKRLGIRTVGHQHGAYVRRHAGYVMEGIDPATYSWFETLIVWGLYWKDHLLKISDVHDVETIVVGCNRLARSYPAVEPSERKPSRILIPYEHVGSTRKVGEYMVALMDLGYRVFFKPRPDEPLEMQLEGYTLPTGYADRLVIAEEVDDELMEQVDIVAGTMTTLIYELLPYGKIVWIFDTEYKHLEDLVEDGLAHKVRLEDLAALGPSFFRPTHVDAASFFNPASPRAIIVRHVLMRSA